MDHGRGRPRRTCRPEPGREHPLPRLAVLAQFSGNEAYFAVPTRCDQRLTIDFVSSGPAEGLFVNEISARVGTTLQPSMAA